MRYPEQNLQKSCLKWFRLQYPKVFIFHPANGGYRTRIEAAIMNGIGVVAGTPDLVICHNNGISGALFVEMKASKGKLSPKQKEVIEWLKKSGYQCEVCNSLDSFISIVNNYFSESNYVSNFRKKQAR